MNKKEARNIAVKYLWNATQAFYDNASKYVIDDKGTLSEHGHTDADCEVIQKELDFLIKKVLIYEKK